MNIPKAKRIKLAKLLALVQEIPTEEGTVLFIEGDLAVDAEVFVSDADGNMVPAPDGTYTSEGKTIVVASGKITEIKEAEADPIDNQDPENPENMDGEGDGNGEGDGKGEGGDPTDTDDPEELKARIAELEAEVAQKDSKIAELEAKIAELEKEPAAESIEDEEKKERKFGKDKNLTLTQRLLKAAHSNN